ncbi:MAG: tyrosine-type recombinase/integrase, partial [Oscillospiraceae bacterium]
RVLSIPLFIQEELRVIYDQQVQNLKNNLDKYNNKYHDYVCVDKMGKLITPHRASDMMLRSVNRNNLPPITLKGLRHTCATLISRLGFNLKFIQDWLGHSTITMAANTYAHIDLTDKLNVSNAMQKNIFADIS